MAQSNPSGCRKAPARSVYTAGCALAVACRFFKLSTLAGFLFSVGRTHLFPEKQYPRTADAPFQRAFDMLRPTIAVAILISAAQELEPDCS
eukprot:1161785-Pelagomonas_calceolata.AAC.18